jgi:hypothetical protein
MALTQLKTGAIADDAVTEDKIANAINTARAANTAKDLTALSASNLTSGTVPDARFPATLPAASAANLTAVPAANITGTLPAISGANLTGISTTPADGSITQAKLNFPVANRNLIINGAMQVAQRGTSSTADGYGTVDRFMQSYGGTDEAPTQAQADVASGTTPYTLGFRKALKITNGNQTSGAGAGDTISIMTFLEAQDIANSGWNYVSASSYITLSFWVKSSVAQNFYFRLQTEDGTTQNYPMETGSLTADTWTKITKTISGNSNLQFDNNVNSGLIFDFSLFRGTDRTGSVSLNAWAAYNSNIRTPDNTSTWYTTNDATFEITGVQLEVGSVATDFEHRSFGQELALCQRYYYVSGTPSGGGGLFMYDSGQTSTSYGSLRFTQTMRATPTVVLRDNNGNTDGKATQHGASHDIAATAADINTNGFSKVNKSSGNWSTGAGNPIICGCTADAEI